MRTGLVEGFYGKPYCPEVRELLLRELSGREQPTYVYAPKDDPWHRSRWVEPYPPAAWSGIASSIRAAAGSGVSFFFGMSPIGVGEGVRDPGPAAVKALMAMDQGAAGIAVLFDDIEVASIDGRLARDQARFVQGLLSALPSPAVLVCPTVYCLSQLEASPGAAEYLENLSEALPDELEIFWTGDDVISRSMSRETLERALDALGRPPLVWDNYLADDYCLRRLHLASAWRRLPESGCSGYLLNPSAIQAAALWQAGPAPEVRPGLEGWRWLSSFHHDPWSASEPASALIREISGRLLAHPSAGSHHSSDGETLEKIAEASAALSELAEACPGLPDGFELLRYVRDLTRLLGISARAIGAPAGTGRLETLDLLLRKRLPLDHPLARELCSMIGLEGDG
ncbi:beta-N-acetylglucosaminidase domain-containing protein [Candidatus Fermentibacterales bacterium]|nr:beta-N-acetylglucosaminidase domain-containing protein [Candidatus Fermentibacterales bacterium]